VPAPDQQPDQQAPAPELIAPAESDVAQRDSPDRPRLATRRIRPPLPERRFERVESRPRRPGFVTAGTIEPVILYGAGALVFGCIFVGLASVLNSSGIAALGFLLVIIGVLAVVVAVLVALVRRESERR
jgi:hypothetical protein